MRVTQLYGTTRPRKHVGGRGNCQWQYCRVDDRHCLNTKRVCKLHCRLNGTDNALHVDDNSNAFSRTRFNYVSTFVIVNTVSFTLLREHVFEYHTTLSNVNNS